MARMNEEVAEALARSLIEDNNMVTGFIGIVTYIDEDGQKAYSIFSAPEQGVIMDVGMARTLMTFADYNASSSWMNGQR